MPNYTIGDAPKTGRFTVGDAPAEATPAPMARMSATTVNPSWIDQAEEDFREGGGRTFMGRALGHLQGRGDQGFSGLGEGPMGADALPASPIMGAVHAAQGLRHGSPMRTLAGVGEAAQIPLAFMAGPEAEAGVEAIPSRARAVRTLADIENQARDVPVTMAKTQPALEEFQQSVKTGGKNAPVIQQLRNRITPRARILSPVERMQGDLNGGVAAPPPRPINFPEARDFYSNVSRATMKPGILRRAIESPREAPFRAEAGGVRDALNQDLTNAAASIGRGEDYTGAMREYRNNARMRKVARAAGLMAAGEAARRTGLLGSLVHKTTLGQ